jgi:hypothetical protein
MCEEDEKIVIYADHDAKREWKHKHPSRFNSDQSRCNYVWQMTKQVAIACCNPFRLSLHRWYSPDYNRIRSIRHTYHRVTYVPHIHYLCLGTAFHARDIYTLKRNNIVAIINVAKEIPIFHPEHLSYYFLPKLDIARTTYSQTEIQEMIAFVMKYKNQGTILVHCVKAESRSVAAFTHMIAYIHKISFADAMQILVDKGHDVILNDSFIPSNQERRKLKDRGILTYY